MMTAFLTADQQRRLEEIREAGPPPRQYAQPNVEHPFRLIEIHMAGAELHRRDRRRIKECGGRYDHCRGYRSARTVFLPSTAPHLFDDLLREYRIKTIIARRTLGHGRAALTVFRRAEVNSFDELERKVRQNLLKEGWRLVVHSRKPWQVGREGVRLIRLSARHLRMVHHLRSPGMQMAALFAAYAASPEEY